MLDYGVKSDKLNRHGKIRQYVSPNLLTYQLKIENVFLNIGAKKYFKLCLHCRETFMLSTSTV